MDHAAPFKFEGLSARDQRQLVVASATCMFVLLFCFLGITPLFPQVAHDLHISPGTLGTLIGLSPLVGAPLQIPIGAFVDVMGARPFLILGAGFLGLGQLVRGFSTSALEFGFAQALMGLAIVCFAAGTSAMIARGISAPRRPQAFGFLFAGNALGQGAGFIVVGLIGPTTGWREISLALAALPIATLPLILSMPTPTLRVGERSLTSQMGSAVRFLLRPQSAMLAMIGALVLGGGTAEIYLVPFALNASGAGAGLIGVLVVPFVIGIVAGSSFASRIVNAVGEWAVGSALIFGSLASLGLVVVGVNPVTSVICLSMIGATVGVVLSLIPHEVATVAEHDGTVGMGAAIGGIRLAQALGPALGPAVAGIIDDRVGFTGALVGATAMLVIGLVTDTWRRKWIQLPSAIESL